VRKERGSPPTQPRDKGACPGELLFIIRRLGRMAAIAHRLRCRINLAESGLGYGGVPAPLGKQQQGDALVAKARGP
jgi:hypothetical protein